MNIEKTRQVLETIPNDVTLIAVTKNQEIDDVAKLVELGVTNLGENKLQELLKKKAIFPDVNWHFFGRIQSNKIKDIVANATLIHSVSELRYLEKINVEAEKLGIVQDVLLQLNIAGEQTKKGLSDLEFNYINEHPQEFKHTRIRGLMTMGDHIDDQEVIKSTFNQAFTVYSEIARTRDNFDTLSMGMSSDYQLAIECGSNMVRIGTLLFK